MLKNRYIKNIINWFSSERNIYKVDYQSNLSLSRTERFVEKFLSLVDAAIFLFTAGFYSGRLSDNYFWGRVTVKCDEARKTFKNSIPKQ